MSEPRNNGDGLHEYLAGGSTLSRAYRSVTRETPPRTLDDRILAEARRAVGGGRRRPWQWAAPLAAAAVVTLSVGLTLFLSERGVAPTPSLPAPAEVASAPAPTTAPAVPRAPEPPPTLAKAERAEPKAAGSGAGRAASVEQPAPAAADAIVEERTLMAREKKTVAPAAVAPLAARQLADVVSVEVAGRPGAYEFQVGVRSPDSGCARYADWWEILGEDGQLLYRRVLAHSHVDEQPFVRSGGPLAIAPETTVWVRAHMKPDGYGGRALKGSVRNGFQPVPLDARFAAGLASVAPLPDGCAF
jgi:hypothetical protein